jgi:hypothetical protein
MDTSKSRQNMVDTAVRTMQAKSKFKTEQAQSDAKVQKLIRKAALIGEKVAEQRRQSDVKWSETKFATDTAIAEINADTALIKKLGIVAFNAYKKRQKDIKSKKQAGKSLLLRPK